MASKFTPTEKRIINLLYVAHRPLTTKQISEKLGIAWKTAKDNLTNLYKNKYVDMEDLDNRIYWWLKTK
jgi:Mn-dependent DtxR family transcriptional regulator